MEIKKGLLNITSVQIKKLFLIYICTCSKQIPNFYFLIQIKYANSLSSLQSTIHNCYEFLAAAGCLRPVTALCDKNMLVNDILIHHVIKRIISPLERFVLFEFSNFLTEILNNMLLKLTFTCSCLLFI